MKFRFYQQEAYESVLSFFGRHPDPNDNPLVAMPTGTGKGVVVGGFCQHVLKRWPGQRILMLTHVQELVEQNAEKLRRMWPQAPLGIYAAGLGSKVSHMPITFASVQSVAKGLTNFGPQDIILIDEAHLVPPDEETLYRRVIDYFRARNKNVRFVGLSATIYRLGLGMLTEGGVFTHVSYDITSLGAFNRLIDEGYLAPLIPMATETVLDVSGVHKRGGEFIPKELQAAVDIAEVTRDAVAETVDKARDRNHWLFFATGIDHAQSIWAELAGHGIEAALLHSKLPREERREAIAGFKSGKYRALINVDILTTGFDFEALDCISVLRPTSSPVLHVQMLGRGTRPLFADGFDLESAEGRLQAMAASPKQNCLVLDFAGNVMRLGPINDPRIPRKKGEGTGDIPVKVCSECGCLCHISARRCDNCDAEFTFDVKLTSRASTAELIVRDEPQVEVFSVQRVTYESHFKLGSPPSLKADYYCGIRRFTEWVCLEHYGGVRNKARHWWNERGQRPPPDTVAEALARAGELRTPPQIRVWVNKKWPEVLSPIFEVQNEQSNPTEAAQ